MHNQRSVVQQLHLAARGEEADFTHSLGKEEKRGRLESAETLT